MADKVVSATIKINDGFSAALSKLSSGVGRGSAAMDQLSAGAGKTGGMFKSMLGANIIGAGVTKGIGMITSGVGSMMSELNESSTAWQTFNGNMAMMGKSPAQIAKTRGGLQKFAQDTIYSASDMASTYSQLAAVGTKGTDKLVKGFGGLAAASSDPQQAMKTLSQQATQAAAKPKIQWQDFKLMLEQTPAGMSQVAKTMHRSTGQLVKDVQAGKVKTQDFFAAIAKTGTNKQFSKMATQYKTVGQAMDGLKETVANRLQPAFDQVSKVGIKAISGFTDSLGNVNFDAIGTKLVPVVQGVVNAVKTAGQAVGAFFSSLGKTGALSSVGSALSSIGKAFGDVMGKLSSGGGKDPFAMFKTLGSISGSAIKGLANGLKAIADVAGSLDPTAIKVLAAAFIALKMSAKGLVLTGIVVALTTLSKLNPGVLNAIAMGIGLLATAVLAFKAVKNVSGIISGIGHSLGGLGKGGGLASAAKSSTAAASGFIKLGVSLLLVGAAVALAGAGLWMMAEAVTSLVSAGWPAVAVFAGMVVGIGILAAVVTALGPAMIAGAIGFGIFGAALILIGAATLIASAGIALLATQLPTIAESGAMAALNIVLLGGALAVFGALSIVAAAGLLLLGVGLAVAGAGFMVAAVGALLFGVAMMVVAVGVTIAAVGMMILAVALPLIAASTMIAAVGMLLMGTAMVVVAAVAMIAGAGMMVFALALVIAAPLMMVAAAGALLLGAASIALGAGLAVAGAGLMVVAAGLRSVTSAVSAMVSAFISGVARLVSGVTSGMASVVSAVRGGMQQAVSAAQSFAGALFSAGVNLIQGLVNGIKSMIGSAVSAVASVASKVVGAAKGALGIHSPSTVFAEIGGYLVQGFANGITGSSQLASRATGAMAQQAIGAMDALNHMPSANPGNLLANGFNNAATAVGGLVSAMQGINGTSVDVNGNLSSSTTGNAPQSTLFGSNAGGYSTVANYSDTSSSEQSGTNVTIQPGAFVLQSSGNADYDAETMVSKIETYLIGLKERRG
ncbi:tape measure protein [Levilactobacillus yiduensis]|uniref:tape measure protein n=1 Tax=Levilactobacillus yiduensis TaxID=2953880 RepID=UPI002157F987|nr:tape measure protein [Levilactobacillus yiduensis]